jgi:hypothetical protein
MSDPVIVAVIGAVGVIGAAGFGTLSAAITSTRRAIGRPNGQGNIVQMMERMLTGQAGQDNRLAALERRVNSVEGHSARAARIVEVLDDRLRTLEHRHVQQLEADQLAREGRVRRRADDAT